MPLISPRALKNYFNSHNTYSLLLSVFLLIPFLGVAQEFQDYDELNVEIIIPRLGTYEIPVAIKDQDAYIAVNPLLDLLQLKNELSDNGTVISGYVIQQSNTFVINSKTNELKIKGEKQSLNPEDYIITPTTLYLKSTLFEKVFDLTTKFNFRSLSIALETEMELPIIKNMRLERARGSMNQVKGAVKPDTTLRRTYPFFKAGMIDWGINTTQQTLGINDNRFNLGIGTMIAGGEANLRLNYSTNVAFTSRNQFYQWRYANNDNSLVKQITAGKIFTGATASLFAPVVGIKFSNTPVINRRSFGTYTISDFTDARWTVELYVNNVLLDFTQADDSGFYSFDVPLMYGNTAIELRFYGPYGEERIEEKYINIPYNFIPVNELEYSLSAGIVEDNENRKFSRFDLNYGLSNSITLGAGAEYLSGIENGEVMPFLNTSIKLAPNLLFTGKYVYNVKAEGLLSFRTPSNLQVDLDYKNYKEGQTAINYNYLEERKISLSSPIKTKYFTAYSRLSINQIVLPTLKFTTAQLLLSGSIMGISTNLTTYGLFNERARHPSIYSILSQSYRLPYKFMFSPQVQYDFSNSELMNMDLELERPFFKQGFFNLSYETNFISNAHTFEVGLRYNFDFAQTSLTSRIGNQNSSFVQSASGSLILDTNTNKILANRTSSVGKAGLTIYPFLDLNANGRKDKLEPGVPGVSFKNSFGKISYNLDGTILRVTDVQPYKEIIMVVDPASLDNIAWRVSNAAISIETSPNYFKPIYIPIQVLGEVAGMVYLKSGNKTKGLGRITVNILNNKGVKITEILTEGDGYFSYLGLEPGKYVAEIDPEQLQKLGYKASPADINFEIEVTEFGDFKDTLEFTLEKIESENEDLIDQE